MHLIITGIDETLTDRHGNLPKANRRTPAEAVERGVHLAVATVRSRQSAGPVLELRLKPDSRPQSSVLCSRIACNCYSQF